MTEAERRGQIRALRSMARWLRKEVRLIDRDSEAAGQDVNHWAGYRRCAVAAARECERRARELAKP